MEKNNHNSVQSANTIANPIKKGWIIASLGGLQWYWDYFWLSSQDNL